MALCCNWSTMERPQTNDTFYDLYIPYYDMDINALRLHPLILIFNPIKCTNL